MIGDLLLHTWLAEPSFSGAENSCSGASSGKWCPLSKKVLYQLKPPQSMQFPLPACAWFAPFFICHVGLVAMPGLLLHCSGWRAMPFFCGGTQIFIRKHEHTGEGQGVLLKNTNPLLCQQRPIVVLRDQAPIGAHHEARWSSCQLDVEQKQG